MLLGTGCSLVAACRLSSEEELKSLLRVKEENGKSGLKRNIKKTKLKKPPKLKIMASGPIILWQLEGEKVEAVTDFNFLDSRITAQ